MGCWSERRALAAADNEDFDPCLVFDINEYLISNWPTLTLKQRQAVWYSCQNDEEFDWEDIENQVDEWVEDLAEQSEGWILPEVEETEEETDEDDEDNEFYNLMLAYVANYAEIDFDEAAEDPKILEYVDELCDLLDDHIEDFILTLEEKAA